MEINGYLKLPTIPITSRASYHITMMVSGVLVLIHVLMFQMLTFGFHGEKAQTSVTSMCFNQQGDLLLVGYGDGHLTVWDVQKATAAKVITGEHTAPVVHTLFLGQDSQVTRQFKAVTGDSKGLVSLHTFSVVPLLNRFSVKTQV